MPRSDGRSCFTTTAWWCFKPSASSVRRSNAGRPIPERTCRIRSSPLPGGGSGRSRPGLRLRYFRVRGSLAMSHFLARPVRDGLELDAAHLVRFAGGHPDASLPVAHGDERVEAEAPAALHDLRDAVDGNDVLDEPVALALSLARIATLPAAPPTPASPAPSASASTAATAATAGTAGTRPATTTRSPGRARVMRRLATRVRRFRRLNRPGA